MRRVVGDGVVDGANVFPQHQVAFLPHVRVAVLGLRLMLKQERKDFGAFFFRQFVDAHRIAGVGVKHFAAGERMCKKNRVRHGWLGFALSFGQRRALAGFFTPHHVPELVEIVQHGFAFELCLQRFW